MRLFFKHLLRSVKNRPTQPLILIFTLAIAVAVSVGTLSLRTSVADERRLANEAKYGNSDIVISLAGSSEARFMFTEDAEKILGEDALVSGYYEIVLTEEDEQVVFGMTTDLLTIENIFDFEFTDYGSITENTLSSVAFISQSYADENSLSLGDVFTLELFGRERTYTVEAISPKPYVNSYDIMLDVGGVMKSLVDDSVFASVLGDDFKPCSTILINLPLGADIADSINSLKSSDTFADKSVSASLALEGGEMLKLLVSLCTVLSSVMAAAVAFSCFYILARERSLENETFIIAGARPRFINLAQYLEVIFFWLVGTVIGALISLPLLSSIDDIVEFKFAKCDFTIENLLISASLLLFVLLLTVTLFIFTRKLKFKSQSGTKMVYIVASLVALCYLAMFLLPLGWRFEFGAVLAILLLILLFSVSSQILKKLLQIVNKYRQNKLETGGILKSESIHFAIKNMYSVKPMHNVTRLFSLLVATVICISAVACSTTGSAVLSRELFNADYVVMNASRRCYDKITSCNTVKSADMVYFTQALGTTESYTSLISASNPEVLSKNFGITTMPEGNGAFISYAEAKAMGVEVGDSFSLDIGDRTVEFTVSKIVKVGYHFVIFDCQHFGIDYNMILPHIRNGASNADFIGEITIATADEIAPVARVDELLEYRLDMLNIYVRCTNTLLVIIVIFALIGLIDNLVESYRVRREEFALYSTAGMSKRKILGMKIFEILISLIFGLVLGILAALVILPILSEMMLSLGYDMIQNLLALFRS